jgi:hypothetical protein
MRSQAEPGNEGRSGLSSRMLKNEALLRAFGRSLVFLSLASPD